MAEKESISVQAIYYRIHGALNRYRYTPNVYANAQLLAILSNTLQDSDGVLAGETSFATNNS